MTEQEKKEELINQLLDKKFSSEATMTDDCDSCGEKCSD